MSIQAWFIILGVGAMMLIVWDGKRCKVKQRVSSASVRPQHVSGVSASLIHNEPLGKVSPQESDTATEMKPTIECIHMGSRIGMATHITGKVIADEPVLIKGHIKGTVVAPNHHVSVTATGHVASYIEGSCVDIDGHVIGTLKANTKATLLSRARIQGVVEAPHLECVAGAWLQVDVAKKASLSRPNVALVS